MLPSTTRVYAALAGPHRSLAQCVARAWPAGASCNCHYVAKVEKKGRTKAELDQVIHLTSSPTASRWTRS